MQKTVSCAEERLSKVIRTTSAILFTIDCSPVLLFTVLDYCTINLKMPDKVVVKLP